MLNIFFDRFIVFVTFVYQNSVSWYVLYREWNTVIISYREVAYRCISTLEHLKQHLGDLIDILLYVLLENFNFFTAFTTSVKWFLEKRQFQLLYNVSAMLLQRLLYGILRNFKFNHFTTFLQCCYNVS
jgi:hypothetical protein